MMKIKVALQAIVDSNSKAVNYAVNYAKIAISMGTESEAFRTQLLYVKSNITHWRGGVAKQVRQSINNELGK